MCHIGSMENRITCTWCVLIQIALSPVDPYHNYNFRFLSRAGAEPLPKSALPPSDDTDQLTDSHVIPNDKSQEFGLSPNSEDGHGVEADSGERRGRGGVRGTSGSGGRGPGGQGPWVAGSRWRGAGGQWSMG